MDLKGISTAKLATVAGADMHTAGKTVLYNIPAGKTAVVMCVVVHSPSATLTGGTDYDFGTGEGADTWKTAVDLSSLTSATDFLPIVLAVKASICAALSQFAMMVNTGSTGDATATIDIFGYLY